MTEITYRKSLASEAEAIVSLVAPFTSDGSVLPRTVSDILEHLENFLVAIHSTNELPEKVVGCVALRDFGDGLEEIRTLCVHPDYHGKQIASGLLNQCFTLAKSRNTTRLFALSLRPNLFLRKGFDHVEKEYFPDRIWEDDEVSPPEEKAVIMIDFDKQFDQ